MIKAAVIGFSHMHVNEVALYINNEPDMKLVAISDVKSDVEPIPPLRYTPIWNFENVKKNYCNNVYEDYKKMLDIENPDIVYILTENCQKPIVVDECAKRGINICIEKPIAMNLVEANKIKESIEKYNIEAYVNWPVIWRPYLHKLKNALDQKIVGNPIKMRYINGHTGPLGKGAKHRGVSENAQEMTDEERSKTWWHKLNHGGGVFLDIACYGCLFSKWLLGDGEKDVISYGANLNTPFGDTEDNFAAIIGYDNKMSVIEGTWSTPRAVIPSGPMVVCSDGVIMCTGGAEDTPDVKAFDMYGKEVEVPNIMLGDEYKNMPAHYSHHIKTGSEIHEMLNFDNNMEVMAMLDAVMRASASGSTEKI